MMFSNLGFFVKLMPIFVMVVLYLGGHTELYGSLVERYAES